MDPNKTTKPGASHSAVSLVVADKQINVLCDKVLPHVPHLLSVPTKTPYQPNFPHENQRTLFEPWEVMKLQYMTLISNGDRGVGYTQGGWEDEVSNARSPSAGALSSTSTPNPNLARDSSKPAVKMSYADYQKFKTTGVKPPLRPATATPEPRPRSETLDRKPTHSRNVSAVSVNTPSMARVPSFEGGDHRPNGTSARISSSAAEQKLEEKPVPPRSNPWTTREGARPAVNGHTVPTVSQVKDANKEPRASRPDTKEPSKHGLPPRPMTPQRNTPEPKQQKRPLDSGASSQPEKRAKVEQTESRTPSNSQKPSTRKAENTEAKPPPSKSQKPAVSPRPPKKVGPSVTKPIDTKSHSSSEKPLNLPPLLSPLPTDLIEPPQPGLSSARKSDLSMPKASSPKLKGVSKDTIVVKGPQSKNELSSSSPLSTPPASSSPPFVLPRLLSPDLPDIVEAELLRLQQKSSVLNTVEARHQEVRQPNAPGVAQKRPKVGHPPKKSHAESSKPIKKLQSESNSTRKPEVFDQKGLIVKIPYKKKHAKPIERLLRTRGIPSMEFKVREAKRLEGEHSAAPPSDESESEVDVPLRQQRSNKAPAAASSKKRPMDSSNHAEPEPKRTKATEKPERHKAPSGSLAPAFKSPSQSGSVVSKEKLLLATPKKGDAMKSVAMLRVDSGDGQVRTPQALSSSTPASAEKPRVNGTSAPNSDEIRGGRGEDAKFNAIGTDLKRKCQAMLSKEGVSENDRKAGVMTGIESIMAYMISFHNRYKMDLLNSIPPNPAWWEQFFPVWLFVMNHAKRYPELNTLVENLGGVSREELTKIYTEVPKESRESTWDKLVFNMRERDKLWQRCRAGEKGLVDLGIQGTLGPWSSVNEAVGFGVAILGKYASKQGQGLKWEGDTHFPDTYARTFITGHAGVVLASKKLIPHDAAALIGAS